MQTWINFWTFFFWLSLFGFIFNPTNFLSLMLYSEITWLTLYCLTLVCGAIIDDATVVSITFLILGLAGLEFVIGFLLLILFKNFNVSYFISENTPLNQQNIINKTTFLSVERFFWFR